ncbi:MAG: phosphatase PAP2 family protein [Clostridia bacterium]|nr:phosphatase PAP2 family protein [Clostridia bacterium]
MFEWIQSVDAAVLLLIQDVLRLPVLNSFFLCFTHLGDNGFLWIVISAILLCFPKTRKIGLAALFAMLLGLIGTNLIIKNLVARPRPYETVLGAIPLLIESDPFSFPSGHTCAAFAAAGVWLRGFERKWIGVAGLLLAVLMGFHRLYVGVH